MKCYVIFIVTIILGNTYKYVSAAPRVDPLVETEVGLIRGLVSDNGQYSMFLGIPYAHVNKSNPFGAAIPNQGFERTFEAYDDSAICPQVDSYYRVITGSLDCLHLNIYAPQTASSRNQLPVLVWIHGGGLFNGHSGRFYYGPNFIMQQEIVLVTFNYRLGPYGFMCLDTPEAPGNQGFKDQLLALQWIKHNIAAFGGDPDKITISGESSGSQSVDIHLLYSPKQLFSKAILQSGSALSPYVFQEPDLNSSIKLAAQLGFETNDEREALSYLSSVDPHLVIAANVELGITFVGCLEKDFDDEQQLITNHPENVTPNLRNIHILIGLTSREYLMAYPQFASNLGNKDYFNDLTRIPHLLEQGRLTDEEFNDMERLVKHFYMGDEDYNEKSMWSLIDLASDTIFNYPSMRSIEKYLTCGCKEIYQYIFSYVGERNFNYVYDESVYKIPEGTGSAHFAEIGYQFDMSFLNEPNADDQLIIDRINTLWANFVKYGNPTPETTELLPVIWPRVTESSLPYLDINSELSLRNRPFNDRMAFWDLFRKHYNVTIAYRPKFNKLPVLIWIHGGGFTSGSAGSFYYGPSYIMQQHIVTQLRKRLRYLPRPLISENNLPYLNINSKLTLGN